MEDKHIIKFIFLAILLMGCSENKINKNTLVIDIKTAEVRDFFSLVDSVFIIELDTVRDQIIGEITSVFISDKIFVTDKNNKLFISDKKGNPLCQISKKGNSPGEYIHIDDIYYDKSKKEILLLDIMQNKIISYSSEGSFVGEYKTPIKEGIGGFSLLENEYMYIYEKDINSVSKESNYNIFVYNEENKLINKFLPFEKSCGVTFSPRRKFFKLDDTLIYIPTYKSTIYNIYADRVEERIHFDFLDNRIDEEYVYDPNNEKNPMLFIKGLQEKNFIYFFNMFESKTHIYSDFWCRDKQYFYINSKLSKKEYIIKSKDVNGFEIKSKCVNTYGDYFIFLLTPTELETILCSEKYSFKNKDHIKNEFNDFDPDKNQLLTFIKFKL